MIEKEININEREVQTLKNWYNLIKYVDPELLTEEDRELKKHLERLLSN